MKLENNPHNNGTRRTDVIFGNSKIYIDTLKSEGLYENLCSKAPITLKNFIGNERIMLKST
jgi:hypothetical protein